MRLLSIAVLLGATVLVTLSASPALAATDDPTGSSICVDIAQRALEDAGVTESPGGSAEFACLGDQVVVTANSGTAEEQRVNVGIEFSDEATEKSPTDAPQPALEVPFTSATAANEFCEYGGYDRAIASELQDDIWGCVLYGEYTRRQEQSSGSAASNTSGPCTQAGPQRRTSFAPFPRQGPPQ